jgi:hypothetical protein
MSQWPGSSQMPGEPTPKGLVTLTIVVTADEVRVLERQALEDGINVTDCIRRSIAVGQIAWESQRQGNRLVIQTPDGELRPIRIPKRFG